MSALREHLSFGSPALKPHFVQRCCGSCHSRQRLCSATDEISTVAEHNLCLEWQLPQQRCTKCGFRAGLPNDKCSRSADIHDAIVAELFCEDVRANRSVAAHVHTRSE